jgi:RNA-directed DNA polymerase
VGAYELSLYFYIIINNELMKSVSRRISDGRILRLLKMWLETPVEETDARGLSSDDPEQGNPEGIQTRMARGYS